MIRLQNVGKTYNKGRANEFVAVEDVSLRIGAGRITVFKGPSGSGKTTLLSLVGCMSRPTRGRIQIEGIRTPWLPPEQAGQVLDVAALPERFLTDIRRHTFGFVFQQFNLIRGLSVLNNVMVPAAPLGEIQTDLVRRAGALLERFGLAAKGKQPVELLSGGEMQRVALARALINNPAVLIADEPTAHLDSRLSREFLGLVAELRAEGRTLIMASHDPLIYESPLVDDLVELSDGRLESVAEQT